MIAQGMQPQGQPQSQGANVVQRIVAAAHMLLNNAQVEQQIIQMVKSAQDPVQGLAQATLFLMKTLFDKSKGTMPPAAVFPAAGQVIGVIAKMCEAAGILKASPQLLEQASQMLLQLMQQEKATQPQQPAQAAPAAPAAPQPTAPGV